MADGPFEFPCAYPLKVMGLAEPGFADAVAAIVLRHVPEFDIGTMSMRPSRNRRYLSVSCEFEAQSRMQLDSLYRELVAHPAVKVVL